MGCAAWLLLWRDVATLAIAGGCFLVTSVIGALLLLEVESVQIAVTEDGLTRYSRWKKPVTLQWVEVEHIRYSTVNRWFVVAGVGRRIHVSRHLSGIAGFVEVMRRKLATARLSAVQSVLDAILNEK
jgi:hypothetical protein